MPERRMKTFDAVEMSRRLREQTSRKLAALTREQRIALLNRKSRWLATHSPRRNRSCAKTPPHMEEKPRNDAHSHDAAGRTKKAE